MLSIMARMIALCLCFGVITCMVIGLEVERPKLPVSDSMFTKSVELNNESESFAVLFSAFQKFYLESAKEWIAALRALVIGS